jgi:hypothetical protein
MHVLEEPEMELVPNHSYVGGISDAPSDIYRLTFQVEAVDRQPQASTPTKVTGGAGRFSSSSSSSSFWSSLPV